MTLKPVKIKSIPKNIPIITDYDFDNVIVRGILTHLETAVPGVELFLVKLNDMASAFISENSVAAVLIIDQLDDDKKDIFVDIESQIKKYNLSALAMALESEKKILKGFMPDTEIIFCGDRHDIEKSKQKLGLYLSRYGCYEKKTILLVDDSGEVLRNVKSWLCRKYDVVMAKSGEMALRYLTKKIPDLILLDYEMPGMNGKEVFQELKKNITTEDIPVFFLTSKNDKHIVLEIMSVHPEGYILKTESMENILARIKDFFDNIKS